MQVQIFLLNAVTINLLFYSSIMRAFLASKANIMKINFLELSNNNFYKMFYKLYFIKKFKTPSGNLEEF